ncbi:MAG: hypothetical protein Q8Q62_09010 [Mesorhizobium sp.]|nr:hypothetical protein [Mesorhizobium sp.]
MTTHDHVDAQQLSTLRNILNDYCELAGVSGKHPAREKLAQRLMTLFREGIDDPNEIKRELDNILKGLRSDMMAI